MNTLAAVPTVLGRYSRIFLVVLGSTGLIIGLIFYIAPSDMVPYWPWPVKELAVRFLGAIFIAISLGCWSALRAKLWQRAKILVLVGGVFFGLIGIVSIARGATTGDGSDIWIWASYFLAASSGCLSLLKLHGWHRRQAESIGSSKVLRVSNPFFGVQTSVVGVFGALMLLLPGIAQVQFWPWKVATPTLQAFGALFIATCFATGWAFLQKAPSRIVVLLPLDAIFPSLALIAVGLSWNVIVSESPSWLVTAVWIGLYSFVAAGSTILYVMLKRESSVPK